MWTEIEAKLQLKNVWIGILVSKCLKNWCVKGEVKHINSLPIIVLWFIWKARNRCCFNDYVLSPFQVSSFCLGLLSYFPQDKIYVKIRLVVVEVIDNSFP